MKRGRSTNPGRRIAAMARAELRQPVSEGTASAQRINAAPLPVRCAHFPACTYPEGQCAELCLPGGLKP